VKKQSQLQPTCDENHHCPIGTRYQRPKVVNNYIITYTELTEAS